MYRIHLRIGFLARLVINSTLYCNIVGDVVTSWVTESLAPKLGIINVDYNFRERKTS